MCVRRGGIAETTKNSLLRMDSTLGNREHAELASCDVTGQGLWGGGTSSKCGGHLL